MIPPTQVTRPSPNGGFSFQRLANFLICLCIVLYALYAGSSFFIPITFGIFFALMLKPICDRFEQQLHSRTLSVLLTLLTVGLSIGAVLFFFVYQIQEILTEAEDIQSGLLETLHEILEYGGEYVGLNSQEVTQIIDDSVNSAIAEPFGLVGTGLSTSGLLIVNFVLVLIYTFFFLLYRTAVKNFLIAQMADDVQSEGLLTLREVQEVAKKYLGGMGVVMLVLGILNSLGLFLIGIDFYLVWGFLGAILAVIPYIGTTIGGLLPFMYAIATTGTMWQPVAVVVLYSSVQFIEGNLITPKILGNSVKINALAAILAILVGSMIWGISGVILAIPLLAMVRIILNHIEPLQPFALLLSDDLLTHSDRFVAEFNAPRYRLSRVFGGKTSLLAKVRKRLPKPPTKRVSETDTEVIADSETK